MIVITPGEPAGIGPDLVVTLANEQREFELLVIADPDLLRERASALRLSLEISQSPTREAQCLQVLPVALAEPAIPGVLNKANAGYVIETLNQAAQGCLSGQYQALVTGPVQKSVIADAGFKFSGHTEYFRDHAGVQDVLMTLVAGNFRVALATTHLPLRDVADAITFELLERKLTIFFKELNAKFGLSNPRILVSGLNPHAGESGHLGDEEVKCITPVCTQFRDRGFDVVGPLPADTLFTAGHLDHADGVLAMFHDQGLPVLKHAAFGEAVNVTLGLPYVRTSVDHGTALDLAATGKAELGSMRQAIVMAHQLASA